MMDESPRGRPDEEAPLPDVARVRAVATRLIAEVERVIVGKHDVIERAVIALLCEGHVLIEDVPGIGKTMLARALAVALGGSFQRIQFTPDLLPTDVTGALVFDPRTAEFSYRPGPIVANVVLADEVNRAGPRTQSALLEAMEERQVTVERERVPLPRPFLVLATQNPVELEGTFPLPEAQLDRFFLRLAIGYPDLEDERAMLRRFRAAQPVEDVTPATTPEELAGLLAVVRQVHVGEAVEDYLLAVVRATRAHEQIELGASPRAALALARAAQAAAALAGRGFAVPDDVRALAAPVLAHRLIPTAQASLRGTTKEDLVQSVVAAVPVPVEAVAAGDD
ncbi:MAG TPA: MoxR family ATPase [Thermomicrobiales bacterium]|nr:MoxR family ATPase [Thermomicrobiales bacterium]